MLKLRLSPKVTEGQIELLFQKDQKVGEYRHALMAQTRKLEIKLRVIGYIFLTYPDLSFFHRSP